MRGTSFYNISGTLDLIYSPFSNYRKGRGRERGDNKKPLAHSLTFIPPSILLFFPLSAIPLISNSELSILSRHGSSHHLGMCDSWSFWNWRGEEKVEIPKLLSSSSSNVLSCFVCLSALPPKSQHGIPGLFSKPSETFSEGAKNRELLDKLRDLSWVRKEWMEIREQERWKKEPRMKWSLSLSFSSISTPSLSFLVTFSLNNPRKSTTCLLWSLFPSLFNWLHSKHFSLPSNQKILSHSHHEF